MFNEIKKIISSYEVLSSRNLPLVCHYLLGLMVIMKKHSFEAIAKMANCHASRFSVLLNNPETLNMAVKIFNRSARKETKRIQIQKGKTFIVIDATFVKRSGRGVQNSKVWHSGSGYVRGHKWVNILLIHEGKVIPLASIPIYTKLHCNRHGIAYRTEAEVVTDWINQLRYQDLITNEDFKKIYFLADSGYDCKKIQKAIRRLGSHFIIALKSSRTVKGHRVTEYFRRHKKGHSSTTIRFIGSRKKRITFQVRLATDILLKGVGRTNVVCSKGKRGSKCTIKYIASSDRTLTSRKIVQNYRERWKIETWHKEVKQNYGFGDCAAVAFTAVHAHVQLVLTAYLLQSKIGGRQATIDEYQSGKALKQIRAKLTQIGQVKAVQTMISEALQARAA